jgi:hypothetical protein
MWIQVGHQHQTITKMPSDALLIGFNLNGAAIRNEREGSVRNSINVSTLCSMTGLYTLSWEARKCDRVVGSKHLNCDHRERLTLSQIDARHNRGAGFIFGNLEQPYIVFDRFYQTVHPAA